MSLTILVVASICLVLPLIEPKWSMIYREGPLKASRMLRDQIISLTPVPILWMQHSPNMVPSLVCGS